jgi:hypothetical protein
LGPSPFSFFSFPLRSCSSSLLSTVAASRTCSVSKLQRAR